jgi:hypothetical protein
LQKIILFNSSSSSLELQVIDIALVEQDHILFECRLTFQVTPQLYQQIDTESLFNLKPELRGALNAASFQGETSIEIEATLQPQLLPQLADQTTDLETAIAYFVNCSQKQKLNTDPTDESLISAPEINPLLSTESWFALNVKQNLSSGGISYRTFWSYLNPASLTPEAIANGKFPEAMAQFLKDRNEANLAIAEKAIKEVLEGIANDVKNWDETEFVKQTESVISNFFSEVTEALESLVEPNQTISKSKPNSQGKIYQAMLNFFSQEDWEFTKLKGELTLRLACQGKNGRWNCFAVANETQQRFIFYSICPLEIPSSNRNAIAEFITRANYGLEIGNFELGFTSGEVRFKTSLDVTGDRLSHNLIERLVYTNVAIMDEYLLGIKAVIEAEVSPEKAILAIEQPDSNTPANEETQK